MRVDYRRKLNQRIGSMRVMDEAGDLDRIARVWLPACAGEGGGQLTGKIFEQ